MSMRKANGFTLIELMIVIAIIAVLAMIAYPNYTRYSSRTRRSEGQQFLVNIAAAEERYFTVYNKYTSDLTSSAPTGLGLSSTNSDSGFYTAAVALGAGSTSFVLTATPQGIQVGDACQNLTLDNIGNKNYGGSPTNGRCG